MNDIEESVALMRKRLESGQGTLASAMCRLSLPMAERLTRENEELREEVQACLEFLVNELHWEYFRAEMLYHDDSKQERQSLQNAQTIKNFLVSRGWRAGPDGAVRIPCKSSDDE